MTSIVITKKIDINHWLEKNGEIEVYLDNVKNPEEVFKLEDMVEAFLESRAIGSTYSPMQDLKDLEKAFKNAAKIIKKARKKASE